MAADGVDFLQEHSELLVEPYFLHVALHTSVSVCPPDRHARSRTESSSCGPSFMSSDHPPVQILCSFIGCGIAVCLELNL